MKPRFPDRNEENESNLHEVLQEILEEARRQTQILSQLQEGAELNTALLEQIGRIVCMNVNATHRQGQQLTAMRAALASLLELTRSVHPEQSLQLERLEKVRADFERRCPSVEKPEELCHFEPPKPHGGIAINEGYSAKSHGTAHPVPFNEEPHPPWTIKSGPVEEEEEEGAPLVKQGPITGRLEPSRISVLDHKSDRPDRPDRPEPTTEEPVKFRTFSRSPIPEGPTPPDMSGAKAGNVVLMSGNLWLKLSVDGGNTFTDIDFTTIFEEDTTYGGWAGDQQVLYIGEIDCFVLVVIARPVMNKPKNFAENVIKVALASPAELIRFAGHKPAWWRQSHFTSSDVGLVQRWMDRPEITHGNDYLFLKAVVMDGNPVQRGWLFFELPLAELAAGKNFPYQFIFIDDASHPFGSPTQNSLENNYWWAGHIDNAHMRIYSSQGGNPNYNWRDRAVTNWPISKNPGQNIISAAPDFPDWISLNHVITGATRVQNELWFAWTADVGDGGAGGFKFPHPHVQIAKFDLNQDYKFIELIQVWNPDHAYAYPTLITNSKNEVGISLAWGGGGKFFGSHAVGILGDHVVWYGEASEQTSVVQLLDAAGNPVKNPDGTPVLLSRWGDFVDIRLAYPDRSSFSAFGYAVLKDAEGSREGKFEALYVEFGR